jgi:hypothetical protein
MTQKSHAGLSSVGSELKDHIIIITNEGFFSFADEWMLHP